MEFKEIHDNKSLLLLQCISGSKAYGLDTPESDTDIKGVYILPKRNFYSLNVTDQVSNEKNDIVYYELKRFIDLLEKNNPNILELLGTDEEYILFKHPLAKKIKTEMFLSKLCRQTFAGYALSQIKKAKGLNKKIINPVDKERKSIMDFCYVISGYATVPMKTWLSHHEYLQEECGLVNITHMKDIYAIFHQSQVNEIQLKGISSGDNANDVQLSSVPKGLEPKAIMSFNKDGYSMFCRDYKEYWDWVNNRNEHRYQNTIDNSKNYDAKNMMHTFRLLTMAEEIAKHCEINVKRKDRDFLLSIKNGNFLYDDLVNMANEKIQKIEELFIQSNLPEKPEEKSVENLLVEIREEYYNL